MSLFDAHARLADAAFPPAEFVQIVARARAADVGGALAVAPSLESSRRALQVADRFSTEWDLWAAVGVDPGSAASINEETITALHRMGQARRVRAIAGGVHLAPGEPPRRVQEAALEALLQLAGWLELPVVLHAAAGSGARLAELLRGRRDTFPGGMIHDFNETEELLEVYLALGLSISLSGRVTDRREGDLVREVLPAIPLERLLIETDAPHHPPKPYHRETERSEPAFLPAVLKEVAHLRHTQAPPIGVAVTQNARRLFGLDGR